MTVKELIQKLQEFDPELEVILTVHGTVEEGEFTEDFFEENSINEGEILINRDGKVHLGYYS